MINKFFARRFLALQPYQAGWNYKTETIDGEATDEEIENIGI